MTYGTIFDGKQDFNLSATSHCLPPNANHIRLAKSRWQVKTHKKALKQNQQLSLRVSL
jgi:hypothetical protein